MGLGDLWRRLRDGKGYDAQELARRLDRPVAELEAVEPRYERFEIPKRSGGTRTILAPDPDLKALQRTILRRLLARLRAHPAALGFERGQSIATHARRHVGKAVVLRLDLRDFFPRTGAKWVSAYFRRIGWNRPATALLVRLTTHEGGLPQGAPTSPRLSNLVNRRVDMRLERAARRLGADYSRYADDLTFSWTEDDERRVNVMISWAKKIVSDEGYQLHTQKKLRIMRHHDRQLVTGLVVNERVGLPRATRRWLRAVRHHVQTGREATLTAAQLDGWAALEHMIEVQRRSGQG